MPIMTRGHVHVLHVQARYVHVHLLMGLVLHYVSSNQCFHFISLSNHGIVHGGEKIESNGISLKKFIQIDVDMYSH